MAEYAETLRRSGERPWYSPQQSPHVSPRGSFASLDRRLLGLGVAGKDTAEFPVVPPERSLVKATIVWRHSGQVSAMSSCFCCSPARRNPAGFAHEWMRLRRRCK